MRYIRAYGLGYMDWDVTIVGAGIAGLSAALRLKDAGLRTLVVDKGRQVGGRMATRRLQGCAFDTGAQFFTATSRAFAELIDEARGDGAVAEWYQRPPHGSHTAPLSVWRGFDGMTALPKWIVARLKSGETVELSTGVRVTAVVDGARSAGPAEGARPAGPAGGAQAAGSAGGTQAAGVAGGAQFAGPAGGAQSAGPAGGARSAGPAGRYVLQMEDGSTVRSRQVILTPPVPQSLSLLSPDLRARVPDGLDELSYHPCIALLITLPEHPHAGLNDYGWVRPKHPDIAWIAENATKGISSRETCDPEVAAVLTVHATPERSQRLYDESDETVGAALCDALSTLMPGAAGHFAAAMKSGAWQVKRWRYAQPREIWGAHSVEITKGLFLAGDIFVSPRVEGAFTSGHHAAGQAIAQMGTTRSGQ